jgi:CBS-domain-containing membrane protein
VPTLREMPLVDASVSRSATFRDAARALAEHGVAAVAVLDEERRVVGLFTSDGLLRGLFPRYLEQLRHTAFIEREPAELTARLEEAASEPVNRHMHEPVTVDLATSAIHVAERFLHSEWGAIAVVDAGRFVGMVDQTAFCRAVMRGPGAAGG